MILIITVDTSLYFRVNESTTEFRIGKARNQPKVGLTTNTKKTYG